MAQGASLFRLLNIVIFLFFYVIMHFVGATPSPSMSAIPNTSTTNLNPGTGGASYTNPSGGDLQPKMTETREYEPLDR
ncbi:hypothetical protein BG000_011930 [Podila horticola]|nr:hypothetical protein BG000_011930 [Podila horticola]